MCFSNDVTLIVWFLDYMSNNLASFETKKQNSGFRVRNKPCDWIGSFKQIDWILQTESTKLLLYLEPFDDPCFGWRFGLVLGGLTLKNRGHWGSRYIQQLWLVFGGEIDSNLFSRYPCYTARSPFKYPKSFPPVLPNLPLKPNVFYIVSFFFLRHP